MCNIVNDDDGESDDDSESADAAPAVSTAVIWGEGGEGGSLPADPVSMKVCRYFVRPRAMNAIFLIQTRISPTNSVVKTARTTRLQNAERFTKMCSKKDPDNMADSSTEILNASLPTLAHTSIPDGFRAPTPKFRSHLTCTILRLTILW